MEARAISKFVRISPFKARQVTRLIQGKSAPEALAILELSPRKAARLVGLRLRVLLALREDESGADPGTSAAHRIPQSGRERQLDGLVHDS